MELTDELRKEGWQPIATHPKDGSEFEIITRSGMVSTVFFGFPPVGKFRVIRGSQNKLSGFVKPLAWRPLKEQKGNIE